MTVKEVKALLQELNFPPRRITEQTAFCILALANTTPHHVRGCSLDIHVWLMEPAYTTS